MTAPPSALSSRPLRIGIAGAGVLGRLLAWHLARSGQDVTVFDPAPDPAAPSTGQLDAHAVVPYAAGFTAAGMLSPLAELDNADYHIAQLGWRSIAIWQHVAESLAQAGVDVPLVRCEGSLMLAHGSDVGAARRVLARLDALPAEAADWPKPRPLDNGELLALEPELRPGLHGWLLPHEAQVFPRDMLAALARAAEGVHWHWGERIAHAEAHRLHLADGSVQEFDLAIDVRGLGATPDLPLRGVRGEVVWLHAPGATLRRPIRLLHARHRVYIVPRPHHLFVVGASEIESEDRSPVSLKSAVELMAAAQSVLPALAEARIVHMETNLRPALPDNNPVIDHYPGLLTINGLFRHGWLLAPALVQQALEAADLPTFPDLPLPHEHA